MLRDEVLSLLKSGEELSGETMSQTLGVSRAAVWKAIETLRGEGYAISSAPRRGYRLEGSPDLLSAGELAAVEGAFTPSAFVRTVTGVDNVCERAALLGAERLLVKKTARDGVTVAVAAEHWEVRFG